MSIEAMKQALEALEQHGTPLLNHEDAYSASLNALRQAIEATERQEPVAKWLPIETAPKDGTAVLVMRDIWPGSETGRAKRCVGHNTYVAAWWADEGNSGEWVCYMDRIEEPICPIKPTHWMQLPPPPIEAAHGKLREKNGC